MFAKAASLLSKSVALAGVTFPRSPWPDAAQHIRPPARGGRRAPPGEDRGRTIDHQRAASAETSLEAMAEAPVGKERGGRSSEPRFHNRINLTGGGREPESNPLCRIGRIAPLGKADQAGLRPYQVPGASRRVPPRAGEPRRRRPQVRPAVRRRGLSAMRGRGGNCPLVSPHRSAGPRG